MFTSIYFLVILAKYCYIAFYFRRVPYKSFT